MPNSTPAGGLFTLNWIDLAESIATAVFVAILIALSAIVTQPSFDVFNVDWTSVVHNMVNIGVVTAVGVLAKNFASDNAGKLFGRLLVG